MVPTYPLISVPSGRFPRAWLQSPRRYAPAGSSAQAIPAGVAALHSNQLELDLVLIDGFNQYREENILN